MKMQREETKKEKKTKLTPLPTNSGIDGSKTIPTYGFGDAADQSSSDGEGEIPKEFVDLQKHELDRIVNMQKSETLVMELKCHDNFLKLQIEEELKIRQAKADELLARKLQNEEDMFYQRNGENEVTMITPSKNKHVIPKRQMTLEESILPGSSAKKLRMD